MSKIKYRTARALRKYINEKEMDEKMETFLDMARTSSLYRLIEWLFEEKDIMR